MITALLGSPVPPGRIAAIYARTVPALHVNDIRREETIRAALSGVPDISRDRVPILCECSDYSGGPLLATRAREESERILKGPTGKPIRRPWDVIPLQAVPADRVIVPVAWRHDVPRRDVIAALLDLLEKRQITVDSGVKLRRQFEAGLSRLRARRDDRDDDHRNEDEDLALGVALCAWYYRLIR